MEVMGKIKSMSNEMVSYKHSPNDPKAVPMKQILDTEPFTNMGEELNASVKLWKTNKTLLNEISIAKSYLDADKINNNEWIELLLRSSLDKQMPSYVWAFKLKKLN